MGAVVFVAAYVAVAVFAVGGFSRLGRRLNRRTAPPQPRVASYPPPVPPATYIPQAEVDRRFAELVGAL